MDTNIENSPFRKSSYSGSTGNCVEVATVGSVMVRDTQDRDGMTLAFDAQVWETFTASLR